MNNKKIKLTVEFEIDEDVLQEKGLKVEDVLNGVNFHEHDAIDGFEITTNIPGCDCAADFFLTNGRVVDKEFVKTKKDMFVYLYPELSKTKDGEYIMSRLNHQGLRIIEDVLQAYNKDRIDVEVVRNEEEQIEFDKSSALIIKDDSYVETGYESLVIKWYEDMEDTGYLVEVFDDFIKTKEFDQAMYQAVTLVDNAFASSESNTALYIASIAHTLKAECALPDNEVLRLTERLYEAQYMSIAPLLSAERVDAVVDLVNHGISKNLYPELPTATPDQAKEFLLNCDFETFIDLVEIIATDNREIYKPDYIDVDREEEICNALNKFLCKKPALNDVIITAEKQAILNSEGVEKDYTPEL